MPPTPAQLAADRANAPLSTGSSSEDGKATAARNALDHGGCATDDTLAAHPASPLFRG